MPEVIFPGAAGRVEGRYQEPPKEGAPIALILHGHPRAGGSMQDRVTVQLYKLFTDKGFGVLRFNFRGIGRIQGVFDNGMGELSDAASALDYLQSMNPNAEQCWVGGYSFGAWIGLQLLDAPSGDRRLHRRGAAGEPLRSLVPRAVPGVGRHHLRHARQRHDGAGHGARDRTHPHAEEHQRSMARRSKAPTTSSAAAIRARITSPKWKCTRARILERRLAAPPRPPTSKR